jgi:hypothetical protein
MTFYQGEDISFRLKGDDVVDFVGNDFLALVYSAEDSSKSFVFKKEDDFEQNGDSNVYDCVISHDTTKDMIGLYNLEVLIIDEEGRRSVYKQDGIFEVEFSYIKDEVDKEEE